ncbi:MAG: ABC transporter ATP-binding protein [Pseudomonadota bacterium]|nr:ABC transporter ATP-binding protein [Pseudomonadota bacterium]
MVTENKNHLPNTLLPFIWHFLKDRWFIFISILILSLASACLNVYCTYALKIVIDALEVSKKSNIWEDMFFPSLFLVACYFGVCITLRLRNILSYILYPGLSKSLTVTLHKTLQKKAYSYFQDQLNGGIVNRIVELDKNIGSFLDRSQYTIFTCSLVAVFLFLLYQVSYWFTLIYLLWLVFFIPVIYWSSGTLRKLAYGYAQSQTNLVGHLFDSIDNMYFVKLFAQHVHEHDRIHNATDEAFTKNIALKRYMVFQRLIGDFFLIGLLVVNIILLLHFYQYGQVSLGDFVFVISTNIEVSWYIWDYFGEQFPQIIEEYGKAEQALTLLQAPFAYTYDPHTKNLRVDEGAIHFANVSYQHSGRTPLFDGFNLTVNSGEKVGLVGFSGSGKTTLLHLLLRFYTPSSGVITIDGQNILDVTVSSLRQNVAMIPQDSTMFHRSILENIRYGRVSATDEEVYAAARSAHAHDFIMQLPDGYATVVGSKGVSISGGQRQRVAIARAFLKDAPILLLDEATSALDSVTERSVYAGLTALMENRTTIVIAHRLSTVKAMDRIVVMDAGEIVEQGRHDDLLKKNGYYARMWREQSSDGLWM